MVDDAQRDDPAPDPRPDSDPSLPAVSGGGDPAGPSADHVTRILSRIEQGDPAAADQLLPLVYEELRRLAAARMAREKPGQTLQATALVHEAYIRLVDQTVPQRWDSRCHFFAAASEAMRRILVERARRRKAEKHGGLRDRVDLVPHHLLDRDAPEEILALDDALTGLAREEPLAANLVKLRIFADFSVDEAGQVLGLSRATAYRQWTYARAWLKDRIGGGK
jgi:RNA polymerase sigma factor (TIGR02999 family)